MVYKKGGKKLKKDLKINQQSEAVASLVSKTLSENNERIIDYDLVYECTKEIVDDENIFTQVYTLAVNLLETKYGVLFDIEKNINL